MASILELGNYARQGYEQGRLGALAKQYYSGQNQSPEALGNIAQLDPRMASGLQNDQRSQKKEMLAQAGQILGVIAAAPDAQTRAQLYQSALPKLQPISQQLGLPLPPQWDESHLPEVQSIAQQFGGASQQALAPRVVGNALVDPRGKVLYQGDPTPPKPQLVQDAQGNYVWVQPPSMQGTQAQPQDNPVMLQADQMARELAAQGKTDAEIAPIVNDFIAKNYTPSGGVEMAPQQGVSQSIPHGIPTGVRGPQRASPGMSAPSGYRFKADGKSLEPIPGGPADHSSATDQGLSQDAIFNAAWQGILTGDIGIRGYGKEATAQRAQIYNMRAKIAKDAGISPQALATTAGKNKALQVSLNNLQKQTDMMQKAEMAFQNNLDVALRLSEKISRTKAPLLNQWLLGAKGAIGDPDIAAFDAAITTAATDYARIMSGQTGAGGTPISTAEEAKKLIRKELSAQSFQAVADVLNQDIAGQQAAVDSQRQTILDAMQQAGVGAPAKPHAATAKDFGGFKVLD